MKEWLKDQWLFIKTVGQMLAYVLAAYTIVFDFILGYILGWK